MKLRGMYCKYANLTRAEIEKYVLPFIPENKRGFKSRFDMTVSIEREAEHPIS